MYTMLVMCFLCTVDVVASQCLCTLFVYTRVYMYPKHTGQIEHVNCHDCTWKLYDVINTFMCPYPSTKCNN